MYSANVASEDATTLVTDFLKANTLESWPDNMLGLAHFILDDHRAEVHR